MSAADAAELVRRELVVGATHLVTRFDGLQRLASMMSDSVADVGAATSADDLQTRVDAIHAGVMRCSSIMLEALAEANRMAALAQVRERLEADGE